MWRQRSLVLLASMTLLGASARADEYVIPNFAGAYAGLAVGVGGHKVGVDNYSVGLSFDDSQPGFTIGGYTGYNIICHGLLFGLEADFNWLNTSPTAYDIEFGPTGLREITSLDSTLNWYGTLRGRVGHFIHENWMLYATGGLAYGQVDHTIYDDCVGCGNSAFNLGTFFQSDSVTKVGWTAGGGTEFLHDGNWMVRAEALYVDLGNTSHNYVIVTPIGTGQADTRWSDQFWVARVGVSYAFGTLGGP